MNDSIPASLEAILAQHHYSFTERQVQLLGRYCQALWEWNEKINLTRHTDFEKFVSRDVLDSWQLAQQLQPGEAVLDVGSGGGVPGLIIAILRDDLTISVCESVGKKARVLEDIVKQLGLSVAVHNQRAEQVLQSQRFTAVTARAVGSLATMLEWFDGLWPAVGRLLVTKGPGWVEERGEARHRGLLRSLELRRVASYPMPGTDSESVVLKIWPKDLAEPGPVEAAT